MYRPASEMLMLTILLWPRHRCGQDIYGTVCCQDTHFHCRALEKNQWLSIFENECFNLRGMSTVISKSRRSAQLRRIIHKTQLVQLSPR
jgi:hypothetical protein